MGTKGCVRVAAGHFNHSCVTGECAGKGCGLIGLIYPWVLGAVPKLLLLLGVGMLKAVSRAASAA